MNDLQTFYDWQVRIVIWVFWEFAVWTKLWASTVTSSQFLTFLLVHILGGPRQNLDFQLYFSKLWGSELFPLRRKLWEGGYSIQQGERKVAGCDVGIGKERVSQKIWRTILKQTKGFLSVSSVELWALSDRSSGKLWFCRGLCLSPCLTEVFLTTFLGCRKLMIMQIIHVSRDTNKLCSVIDFHLVEERIFKNYILLP